MAVLGVLLVSWMIFRVLGFLGVRMFNSWRDSARFALALMLLFTAAAHFTSMKADLVRMVPAWVPAPDAIVFFTGLCEIAGAIGLIVPYFTRPAAISLIVFFLAVLPANINAVRTGATLRGRPATSLMLRIPMQILFIVIAGWIAATDNRSKPIRRPLASTTSEGFGT
ncbi:MAG TPA: DoxX family protein [Terriglobales bacterium]|nr:DoxX family protein [Terriglobales bacterium]